MLEDEEEEEEEKREEEEDGGGRGGWTNMPPAGAGVEFQGLTFCWARLFDRQKYHGGGDIVKSWQTKPTSRKSDVIVCSSPLSVLLNVFFLFL